MTCRKVSNEEKQKRKTHFLKSRKGSDVFYCRVPPSPGPTVWNFAYGIHLLVVTELSLCSTLIAHTLKQTHTHTWLTGKLSLMASTGAWKGQAKLCFHNVFNTTFCKYWKRAKTKKIIIHTLNKWNWHFTSRHGSQINVLLPAAGWSVVWVWRGSMFRGVEGWRG